MRKITRKQLRPFLNKYKTNIKLLEIGGGRKDGNHSFDDLFPNRHAFDIDPDRKPDTLGDAHDLPFENSSYEFILCTEVLEHLHSPWIAINEMSRVLKPGGLLVLTTRFVYPIHDAPNDYYRYTKYGLENLFKDWEIIELVPETETMTAIGALLQRVCFQAEVKGGKLTKALLYSLVYLLTKSDFLVVKEFGDIKRTKTEKQIITTGYYLAAKKK